MQLSITLALSILFAASSAFASELSEGWTSVRALGMGNAYTSVVDNSDALFYNPANLCRVKGINWTVFDPRIGINNPENLQAITAIKGINDDVAGALRDLYGKQIWAGGGMKTAITIPCFGVGAFATTEAGYYQSSPPNTTLNLNFYFDYGFVAGGGFDLVPGILSLGMNVKRINRTGRTSPLGAATLANMDPETLQEEFKRRGIGYGLDIGATFRLPGPVSPSISAVYKNLGGTAFSHQEGAGAPPSIESELVIGTALSIDAGLVSVTPALDFRQAMNSKIQTTKKINAGVEVGLFLLDLRAGLHQGYWTAGVGLNMGILKLDVASWGVELGEYPGQNEDRRYMAQVTFELGFDPNLFGIFSSKGSGSGAGGAAGGGGERRRLKQRR